MNGWGWDAGTTGSTPATKRYLERIVLATQPNANPDLPSIGCSSGSALNAPGNPLICRGAGCTPAMLVPLPIVVGALIWLRRRLARRAR
jgi:hypothetical protein